MNIYQKLIEVRKTCEYLKKDNQGHQFKYVSSSQTLGTLRAAMDKYNLLLIPCVTGSEVRERMTKNGNSENYTLLEMTFTWLDADNPEEKLVCPWIGQGLDSGEKGVGKALTYAEKYFLLKFFNIATDKDDPDSMQGKGQPAGASSNMNSDKPWYDSFAADKQAIAADINSGRKTGQQIISELSNSYRLNGRDKDSILALDKQAS